MRIHSAAIWAATQGLGTVTFFAYASFFEWTFHRYVMHDPRFWTYPFRAHALTHHRIFRADTSYHLQRDGDRKTVTFAWWNAPALLLLHIPIVLGVQYIMGLSIFWGGMAALFLYYGLYEYLHWVMHVPKDRRLERTRVFRWINTHHRLHHQRHFKNLNVVFPLADFLLGTRAAGPFR